MSSLDPLEAKNKFDYLSDKQKHKGHAHVVSAASVAPAAVGEAPRWRYSSNDEIEPDDLSLAQSHVTDSTMRRGLKMADVCERTSRKSTRQGSPPAERKPPPSNASGSANRRPKRLLDSVGDESDPKRRRTGAEAVIGHAEKAQTKLDALTWHKMLEDPLHQRDFDTLCSSILKHSRKCGNLVSDSNALQLAESLSNGVDVLQIKYSICLAMKNDFTALVKKVLDKFAFDILRRAPPIDLICAISAAAQLATFELRS